jgi:hypothetical protein
MEATGQKTRNIPYGLNLKIKPAIESLDQRTSDRLGPKPYSAAAEDVFKKVFCQYYAECLNLAASDNWPQFTCQNCNRPHSEIEIKPSARELMGYYRLLHKVLIGKRNV